MTPMVTMKSKEELRKRFTWMPEPTVSPGMPEMGPTGAIYTNF